MTELPIFGIAEERLIDSYLWFTKTEGSESRPM
ncbi:hypothetical protein CLV84_1825 [Neolewinella xylanilytica]|uniref:Uncharacterized protein n=1 Tax=Neolewinella xylanilytica TaxID=1514080 RepID=A0A2S6IBG8_9BACT|nr:hypothetical protein CLV84_1825 [Neolewinella xylanilytica]